VVRALILCSALWISACAARGRIARLVTSAATTVGPFSHPDWTLTKTQRLTANDLWMEHNGGAGIYVERGCVSETLADYTHRTQPWTIRSSVFDQTTPAGARALFDYYRESVDDEIRGIEPIGQATYLWKSSEMGAWIVGFCKGKHFVELSLAEKGSAGRGPSDSAREALFDFARRLAETL